MLEFLQWVFIFSIWSFWLRYCCREWEGSAPINQLSIPVCVSVKNIPSRSVVVNSKFFMVWLCRFAIPIIVGHLVVPRLSGCKCLYLWHAKVTESRETSIHNRKLGFALDKLYRKPYFASVNPSLSNANPSLRSITFI